MGQKVNPTSMRLTLTHDWSSKWFTTKNFATYLVEDAKLRKMITKQLGPQAGIDRIIIERKSDTLHITISTARPGVVIGRGGAGINSLRTYVENVILKDSPVRKKTKIEISEIRVPELSAAFVAQNIGIQLSKRINFRRAAKQAIERTMQRDAKGIKISIAGRLNGAEIARTEKFNQGNVPLSQFKADIDYAMYHAPTTFGTIGIKVWIYKGTRAIEAVESEGEK